MFSCFIIVFHLQLFLLLRKMWSNANEKLLEEKVQHFTYHTFSSFYQFKGPNLQFNLLPCSSTPSAFRRLVPHKCSENILFEWFICKTVSIILTYNWKREGRKRLFKDMFLIKLLFHFTSLFLLRGFAGSFSLIGILFLFNFSFKGKALFG